MNRIGALTLTLTLGAGLPALAQDSDQDGVPDGVDAFPCDGAVASVTYAPSVGTWSMLLFEDQWPLYTDLDFNDVVVRTHYRIYADALGGVVKVQAFFDTLALGGVFDNGLALQLPAPRGGASVQRRVGGGAWQALTPEPDAALTVILSANLRELFGDQPGPLNALAGPRVPGQLLEVEVDFASPVSLDAALAPFDVFIFRAGDLGHQIHFPSYNGTSAMQTGLFNTGTDRSVPGRSFLHFTGIPFALDLQNSTVYPVEAVAIDQVFPDIIAFATSGGATHRDFYLTHVNGALGHDVSASAVPPEGPAAQQCTYRWQTSSWGACGQGTSSLSYGPWGACTGGSGSWQYAAWSGCSASAVCSGSGSQSRTATCNATPASGAQTRSAACDWDLDSGTQTRNVTCVDRSGSPLPDAACLDIKPASSQACTPVGVTTCGAAQTTQSCDPTDPAVCGAATLSQSCASPSGSQSCAITHGTGSQTCSAGSTTWSGCTVTGCNSGYQISGNACVPTSPCRSGYFVVTVASNATLAACPGQKNAALDSGLNLICCAGSGASCTSNGRTYTRGSYLGGDNWQQFYNLSCQ